MKKYFAFFILCTFITKWVAAQQQNVVTIKEYTTNNASSIIKTFSDFLYLPNVAADSVGQKKNVNFIMNMMAQKGIEHVQLLRANTAGVPPAIYGDVTVAGATKTLIFYAHYDGQPVNPAQWAKGLAPFQPMLFSDAINKGGVNIPFPVDGNYNNEWRIYARGASDDKAGIDAIINAYDAVKNSGLTPSCNLKFFFEGEEEAGSPHLHEILEQNQSLLQSDLWIICDGPVHQSGKKQIVFGVRGDVNIELTVYASKRPLHSGHYGNWAPNPAMMLAKLLASMKDDNGKVTIKGFYDDIIPLSPSEKKALNEVPAADVQLKKELGISAVDTKGLTLNEAINQPSLNINGMQSGNVGGLASNQIPTYATAVLDLRLVLGNDWKRQRQKVIDHIKAQGYYVCENEPTDEERAEYTKIVKVTAGSNGGVNAQRTSMDLPIIQKVITAVKATTQNQVVLQPTMGGTLPLFVFEQYLKAHTVTVPVANHDNNQHAENENIRIGNLFEGIVTMASIMMLK